MGQPHDTQATLTACNQFSGRSDRNRRGRLCWCLSLRRGSAGAKTTNSKCGWTFGSRRVTSLLQTLVTDGPSVALGERPGGGSGPDVKATALRTTTHRQLCHSRSAFDDSRIENCANLGQCSGSNPKATNGGRRHSGPFPHAINPATPQAQGVRCEEGPDTSHARRAARTAQAEYRGLVSPRGALESHVCRRSSQQ